MNAMAKAAMRRGWCPSTLRPMETGDGWIVRLHPPGAKLSPQQLLRIATLAAEHGNGLIEISARANLQLRGITRDSHPLLVEALLAGNLVDEHEGDGPQRITLVSPLAGIGRAAFIDARGLAEAIEAVARGVAGLPPKFGVVVDDGGPSALNGFPADIRLVGTAPGELVLRLAESGWLGPVAERDAAELVSAILRRFAGLRDESPQLRRMRDLAPESLDGLVALEAATAPPARPTPQRAGLFPGGNDAAALAIGLAFGRSDAGALAVLAQAVEDAPATIRPSPWRGLVFSGLSPKRAETLLRLAEAQGLIVEDDDPRLSIQACAGRPRCVRGEAPASADAERLARALPELLRQTQLHVSGCAKGCAHPAASALTLVGHGGTYGVVIDGRSDGIPVATLDLPALLARLQPGGDWRARLAAHDTRQDG